MFAAQISGGSWGALRLTAAIDPHYAWKLANNFSADDENAGKAVTY
jgi:hypothetical protein